MKILPHRMYRLTADVKNPSPDLRKTRDWRARPVWPRDTVFRSFTAELTETRRATAIYAGHLSHLNTYEGRPFFDLLAEHLEEVKDFAATLYSIKSEFGVGPDLLIGRLILAGKVNYQDLRDAASGLK